MTWSCQFLKALWLHPIKLILDQGRHATHSAWSGHIRSFQPPGLSARSRDSILVSVWQNSKFGYISEFGDLDIGIHPDQSRGLEFGYSVHQGHSGVSIFVYRLSEFWYNRLLYQSFLRSGPKMTTSWCYTDWNEIDCRYDEESKPVHTSLRLLLCHQKTMLWYLNSDTLRI